MNRRFSPSRIVLFASLALVLLAGCSASTSSSTPVQAATEDADAPSIKSTAVSQVNEKGSNSARFVVDGAAHEFSSNEGGMYRNAMVDAPDVEMLTFEAFTTANDLYAKVDVNVAKGSDPEGEYVAGNLGKPEHRNVIGHGQVTLAVEKSAESGRDMYPSGSGRITIKREGDQYRADFESGGDGMFRPADAPAITGHVQVNALPN